MSEILEFASLRSGDLQITTNPSRGTVEVMHVPTQAIVVLTIEQAMAVYAEMKAAMQEANDDAQR